MARYGGNNYSQKMERLITRHECNCQQPFVIMEKSPKFFGFICPNCGRKLEVEYQEYWLKKLKSIRENFCGERAREHIYRKGKKQKSPIAPLV